MDAAEELDHVDLFDAVGVVDLDLVGIDVAAELLLLEGGLRHVAVEHLLVRRLLITVALIDRAGRELLLELRLRHLAVEDFLARVGLSFDQTKTPAQIGTLSADFAETKTGSNGLVYVGIYGWTVDPLREYYILDDWGAIMPAGTASDGTPRDHVGTITVDGGTYEVWKKTRTNKPAITGDNKTFDQYFSIRQTARQCGHISISEHFTQWNNLGLPLGKLYEAKILVEAQDTTGTVDFTKATVVVR